MWVPNDLQYLSKFQHDLVLLFCSVVQDFGSLGPDMTPFIRILGGVCHL